jgi:hypothetical protein
VADFAPPETGVDVLPLHLDLVLTYKCSARRLSGVAISVFDCGLVGAAELLAATAITLFQGK